MNIYIGASNLYSIYSWAKSTEMVHQTDFKTITVEMDAHWSIEILRVDVVTGVFSYFNFGKSDPASLPLSLVPSR